MDTPPSAVETRVTRWPIRALAVAACATAFTYDMRGRHAGADSPPRPPPAASSTTKPTKHPPAKGGPPKKHDKCGRKREGLVLSGRLNLNTTTEKKLSLLPGVGPAKARRVIRWRARHKRFRRVRDLRRVRGFGYRTVRRLKPYLSVTGPSSLAWRTLDDARAFQRARAAAQKRPTTPTR